MVHWSLQSVGLPADNGTVQFGHVHYISL
jgi:hypothetical protein